MRVGNINKKELTAGGGGGAKESDTERVRLITISLARERGYLGILPRFLLVTRDNQYASGRTTILHYPAYTTPYYYLHYTRQRQSPLCPCAYRLSTQPSKPRTKPSPHRAELALVLSLLINMALSIYTTYLPSLPAAVIPGTTPVAATAGIVAAGTSCARACEKGKDGPLCSTYAAANQDARNQVRNLSDIR
ncbi:hypothetical protein F5B17DRAFT_414557 [Nemania serpens]|nr:hypothetical protein F5B17DRAFT_414557 [Nemania serpens]